MFTMPDTPQAIQQYLGISSLGQILTPTRYTFESQINYTTIAAGGNQQGEFQNESGNAMVVYGLCLIPFITAPSGSAIARTPAALEASPTAASNTWMNLSMFDLDIQTNTLRWHQSKINAAAICGTGTQPAWMRPRVIPAGQITRATLYNNSAESIQAALVFLGMRVQTS